MAIILGKIAGVPIELHWTFILLFAFALIVSLELFAVLVLLFAMVVLHELAHAMVSKRNNIRVKRIILMFLGGGTIIDQEAASPEVSFRISLAGPLMSLLLTLIFGIFAIYSPLGMIRYWFQITFELNALLFVFNILPAFPLDGGRVLKSYLQRNRDDLGATKLAVRISRITLFLFIAATIVYTVFFTNESIGQIYFVVLWDLIIIMFVSGAAQSELQVAEVSKAVQNLKVSAAMSKNYAVVKPSMKISQVYDVLLKERTHIVFYTKEGRTYLINKISQKFFLQNMSPDRSADTFGTEIPTIPQNASVSKAISIMRYEESSILAVVSGKKIVGVITSDHLDSIIGLHGAGTNTQERQKPNVVTKE